MKKLLPLLALAFSLLASPALATCNGQFNNGQVCGVASGGPQIPGAVSVTSFIGSIVGGTNGQIQYNNSGLFGGFTASGDFTINTGTGVGTLSTVNANVGSFGTPTQIAFFTVNAKGLLTAGGTTTIAPGLAQLPQLSPNSIWINNTNATSIALNVVVPACANDGVHALVYINGTGLQCASLTVGAITTILANTGVSVTPATCTSGTCTLSLALTNAATQINLADPAGTTTTVGAMMGFGSTCKLTLAYSTRIELQFIGNSLNTGVTGFNVIKVFWGTGTAPSNGAAATGTQLGQPVWVDSPSVASTSAVYINGGIIFGLVTGIAYWFDLNVASNNTGNTGKLVNNACTAREF